MKKVDSPSKVESVEDKIVVDMSRPLPTDKYVGLASPNREDDEKAREQYMRRKYEAYL